MLLGISKIGASSQLLSGSSPKTSPYTPVTPYQPFPIPGVNAPAPRTEYVTLPKAPPVSTASADEDIPEIVVTGKRIPWFAWVAAGVAGFAVLDSLLGRR
jgi:hypothetical protein